MASTYYLHQQYGVISPSQEVGTMLYGNCKWNPVPVIEEATTNQVYNYDATADYQAFNMTGLNGYYDAQFGMRGVGSARYTLNGANPAPSIKFPSAAYFDTGSSTYKTGALYVYSEYALQFRLDMQLQDGSGNAVGSTDSTTITITPNQWNRIETVTTGQGQKFLMTLNILGFSSSTDTGKRFWVDSVQVENKRYSTSFFNGVNRIQSVLDFQLPTKQTPDYTITCWARVGNQTSTAAGATSVPFFTVYNSDTDYVSVYYNEGTATVTDYKTDATQNTSITTSTLNLNPGDLVFVALVNDGLTHTLYIGKNGGSLINASGTTDFQLFDTIQIGRNSVASTYLNGPIENLVYFKKALSSGDINTIFTAANPIDYTYDTHIGLVYAGPSTIGTSKALSYAGVGSYRYSGNTVSLDMISASSMSTNSEYNSSTETNLVYGNDVTKLELNGYIATGLDLTTATLYKTVAIQNSAVSGSVAFVGRA